MSETGCEVYVRFDADEWKFIHQVRNVLYEANLDRMTISEFIKEACLNACVNMADKIQEAAKDRPELLEEAKRIVRVGLN